MKQWQRILLIGVGLALVIGGAGVLNWVLSRPDRLLATKQHVGLQEVRDELLRYEDENRELPKRLEDLVPNYVRLDEIKAADGRPLYVYQPEKRSLTEAAGAKIHGLYTWTEAPQEMVLPPMQTGPVPVALNPPPPPPQVKPETKPETKPEITPEVKPNTQPEVKPEIKPEVKPVDPVVVADPNGKPPAVGPAVEPAPPVVAEVVEAPTGPFADGRITTPKDPGFGEAPAGCLVWDAEDYSDTNYAWEVHADNRAGGGAYLHCKEGIANGPAQTNYHAGNFYDVKGTTDVTFLRYYFHLPKAGKYYIYGRMWTTDTHCSNNLSVDIDQGGPYTGAMENRTPFRWLWSPVGGNPRRLAAGDHFLHVFIHEDGIRVDQYILSPVPIEPTAPAYKANFMTGKDTAYVAKEGPGVELSYDLKTMIFTPTMPVDCKLSVRKIRPSTGTGHFKTVLQGGGADGGELAVSDVEVDLSKLPELCQIPLSFKGLEPEKLPRREFLLRSDLLVGDKVVASCHIPLIRPYAWEFFGPGGFLRQESGGPLDGLGAPKPGDKRTWEPFKDASFDHFGVLDFGVQFDGNMKHPRENATVYAQTRVLVAEAGEYLLKLQADDQMILWVDGKEVFRHDEIMPVTRGVDRQDLHLEKGEHTFRFRLNQYSGPWQAYMMIRAKDDDLCNVVGLPLAEPVTPEAKPDAKTPEAPKNQVAP